MNKQKTMDMALFKFSIIAPVVNNTFDSVSISQYFREIALKKYILPNGKVAKYSPYTFKKWYLSYKNNGIDALDSRIRRDMGKPRKLSNDAIEKIHSLKSQFPHITGTLIYSKLIEDGYINASDISKGTIFRYIRNNNLKRSQVEPVERKAYEMEFANDCWQSDTSNGPIIKFEGHKRQTYLIIMLDDASRLILHGEFFFNDNAVNMQIVFKKAIAKYGIPKRLFVDNGSSYKNDQLRLICASLGIVLIHTKAYSPESKGKVERSFRTIKDNWMNGIDWNDYSSLEELNSAFNVYLNEKYINVVHSSVNNTPRKRYLQDKDKIKYIPLESLEEHFLHRVTRKVNKDCTVKIQTKDFEVSAKYIGQRINVRYSPNDKDKAYIFDMNNKLTDTIYPLNRIDNSKVKRKTLDYSKIARD